MPSCDFNAIATCTCAECNAYYRRNDEVVESKENQQYDLLSTTQLPEQKVVSCPIMKSCLGCSIVFEREAHFFRAGDTWQSRCKRCHVIKRRDYKDNRVYVKKGRGWASYSDEKKADIKQMFTNKIKPPVIKEKYTVCLATVYSWRKICAL
jgi:hypothetical protein